MQFAALHFTGEESASFLQGQITADIHNLSMLGETSDGDRGLAGLCNTKGRLIANMWMIRYADDNIVALLPEEMAETIQTRLTRYIFRSKVSIAIEAPSDEALATLPQGLSIPWITAETSEKFVPQMISFDLLEGVSFKKGCYTGQEIVARMHFLGTHKRRLAKVSARETLAIGDKIETESGKNGGEILYTMDGKTAFAVLYLDQKAEMLSVNNAPITLEKIWEDEPAEA